MTDLSIYDNPAGTSRAYLSVARKNGKSALIAAIVLAHLVGPEAQQNSQIISGARSRDQASLVFKLLLKRWVQTAKQSGIQSIQPQLQNSEPVLIAFDDTTSLTRAYIWYLCTDIIYRELTSDRVGIKYFIHLVKRIHLMQV